MVWIARNKTWSVNVIEITVLTAESSLVSITFISPINPVQIRIKALKINVQYTLKGIQMGSGPIQKRQR